jgi:Tol biopolymer transport system component
MRERVGPRLAVAAAALSSAALLAAPIDASYPGRDGRILFQPFNAGAGEGNPDSGILTIRPNGSGLTKLRLPRDAQAPAYAPDGQRLVYAYGSSPTQLYIARADGTHARRLTRVKHGADSGQEAWAPDGKRIAFAFGSDRDEAVNQIGVIRATGGSVRVLMTGGLSPAWSVRGRIAYELGTSIWSMNTDGRDRRRLTRPPAQAADVGPNWSPDGRHLLFARLTETSPDVHAGAIVKTDANGGHLTQVSPRGTSATDPAWAPNGRQIAFQGPDGQLWVMDANGSNAHGLTHLKNSTATAPDWQPLR